MTNLRTEHFGNYFGMGLIRTLLAISVVIAHSSLLLGYNIANGVVAVQIFYIFSGFYIFMVLSEHRYKSIRTFYLSRALRLFPIYFFIVLLTIITWVIFGDMIPGLIQKEVTWNTIGPFEKLLFIFSNLTLFFQDLIMFFAVDSGTGKLFFTKNFYAESLPAYKLLIIPQAWTLGVELLFYTLAPLLVRTKTLYLCIIAIGSLLLRVILVKEGLYKDPWNYRFFPIELVLFLFGGLGFRAYTKWKHLKSIWKFSNLITIVTVSAILMFQFLPIGHKIDRLFFFYLFIGTAVPFVFHASRFNQNDRLIGELSYPIYITHHLIIVCFTMFFSNASVVLKDNQLFCIPIIILSILFSVLINKFVQEPIDKFRRFSNRE